MENKEELENKDLLKQTNAGNTLTQIANMTDLNEDQIDKTINALNQPKTNIFNETKFASLKKQNEKNASFPKFKPKIEESEYGDYLDKMEYFVFQNYLINEICEALSISAMYFHRILNSLQNSTSLYYNPERYQKIKNQIEININEKRRENGKNYGKCQRLFVDTKLNLAQRIANNEITVFEASHESKIPLLAFFLYLQNLQEEDLATKLKPILEMYGFGKSVNSNKSLQDYPKVVQEEILLMALTYRVSFKSLASWFGVTLEDVIATFDPFISLQGSIYDLFAETVVEDENTEKWSLWHAKNYWRERNKLITELNTAKKEGNKEKIDSLKEEIRKLRAKINDTLLWEALKKEPNEWTEEEKEILAWYPIKYSISIEESAKRLNIGRERLARCQENFATKNMIFSEKMDLYKKTFQEVSEQRMYETTYFSRGGGSR